MATDIYPTKYYKANKKPPKINWKEILFWVFLVGSAAFLIWDALTQ